MKNECDNWRRKYWRVSKRLMLLTPTDFDDALQFHCPACFADGGILCGPLPVPLTLQGATHAERHALARYCGDGATRRGGGWVSFEQRHFTG